jgi:hypothetical protein
MEIPVAEEASRRAEGSGNGGFLTSFGGSAVISDRGP